MASKIKIKRSSVPGSAPTTGNLDVAEIAINTADGIMYSANTTAVFEVGSNLSSLSVSGGSELSNVSVNDSLLDSSDRVFKVYYANGVIAWG